MSFHAGDDPDVAQPWFLKKRTWIIALIVVAFLLIGMGVTIYLGLKNIPDIGGGLPIEADPDTRIYIGDKLVGTTQVSFTWEELFGDERHPPLVEELSSLRATVTPEMASGPGAVELDLQGMSGGGS